MANPPRKGKQSPQNASRKAKAQAAAPNTKVSRTLIGVVIGVVAVVAIAVAVALAVGGGDDDTAAGGTPTSTSTIPAGGIEGGKGIVVNAEVAKSGAPTLDIYFDFQCPFCGELEKSHGEQIQTWAQDGTVKLVLHPKTFLDTSLKNDASSRAANAFACAAQEGKGVEYYSTVFANQPAHEGDGWTDAQLEQFATDAGLTGAGLDSWKTCVKSKQFASYIEAVETQSQKDGVFSTPTLKLNGTELDLQTLFTDPAYLQNQVTAATK